MIVKANKNSDECETKESRLYAPGSSEFVSAYVLDIVFQAEKFNGLVQTSGNQLRRTVLKAGKLRLGCCQFNKATTATLRRWAQEETRG